MHKPGEHDVVAEWRTLMRRWETACMDYSAVCEAPPDTLMASAHLERVLWNLAQIKEQIYALISTSSGRRVADRASPRFALIQPTTDDLG